VSAKFSQKLSHYENFALHLHPMSPKLRRRRCENGFVHTKLKNIMKKFILTAALTVFVAAAVVAQPRAIGGRLGYGIEFSYQHSVGSSNMIQAELSFPGFVGGIGAAATYDWIFPITSWTERGEWNWYAGVGAGLGFGWPNVDKATIGGVTSRVSSNWFNIGVAGRIGVEYNFWFPLQLSFDWRPLFGPSISWTNSSVKGGGYDQSSHETSAGFYAGGLYAGAICLGVRYKF